MKTSANLQSNEHKIISILTNIFKTNWGKRLLFIFGWKHLILRLSYSCGNNSHQYFANIMSNTIFGNYRARGSFLDYQRVSLNPLNALYQKIRRPTDFIDRTCNIFPPYWVTEKLWYVFERSATALSKTLPTFVISRNLTWVITAWK